MQLLNCLSKPAILVGSSGPSYICAGYLGYPFKKMTTWSITTFLFFFVM
jgi:hypothetical protein